MPRKARELSALAVARLKAKGRHAVGGADGLHLHVAGNSRAWVLRVAVGTRTDGKGENVVHRRDIGLGPYPEVSLAEAREKAREMRRQVRDGIDPLERRRRDRALRHRRSAKSKTFRECAEAVLAVKSREISARPLSQWRASLARHAYPALGDLPVDCISKGDVAAVLEPLWKAKNKTAKKLRGRIEAVLDYAKAMECREGDNPAAWKGTLQPILGSVRRETRPQPSLPYAGIGAFAAGLRRRGGIPARALEFIILTAARAGEAFGATWDEIDLSARTWTVPKERMKGGREHRVPLSEAATRLLESLPRLTDSRHVFPAARGGRLAHGSVTEVIREMHEAELRAGGRGFIDPRQNAVVTTHGFRSTFRDWAGETTAYPREVCEHALAHRLATGAEAAYQRGDFLAKRARLMEDWADFCGGVRTAES